MSGLQEFHHFEEKPNKTRGIVAWVAVALVLGGATIYFVESDMLRPQPQQAGQTYPRGL
jgi:hypothetical protein